MMRDMVPPATVSAVAGAHLNTVTANPVFGIVANPGSNRMRLRLVRAAAANSSAKESKSGSGGCRTHGGGFAI
jgi:hypothetical protein